MPLDENFLYNPRTMMEALHQNPVPRRFLMETFFSTVETFDTETVDIDIEKSQRCVAGFTSPDSTANVVEKDGYDTFSTRPGYIKEMMPTKASDLLKRMAGETLYSTRTPMQRAAELLGKNLRQLDERIVRREELMCAEALFTGKIVMAGTGFSNTVDFRYEAGKHLIVLSGGSLWNSSTGDPLEDMEKWRTDIIQRCGIAPTHAIAGSKVIKAIRNNPQVKEKLDNRRFELGKIETKDMGKGVRYIGTFNDAMLDIYAYDEWYVDPVTKQTKPIVPEDTILLGSNQARAKMCYGLIQNLNSMTASNRFPWSWVEDDGRARYVQLECAPLPDLIQADAFQVAKVVA